MKAEAVLTATQALLSENYALGKGLGVKKSDVNGLTSMDDNWEALFNTAGTDATVKENYKITTFSFKNNKTGSDNYWVNWDASTGKWESGNAATATGNYAS